MGLPVAVLAEHGALGGAENGGWRGVAGVAELRPGVLGEQLVGGVDFAVAGETELGGVSSAVYHRRRVVAVVADAPPRGHRVCGGVVFLVAKEKRQSFNTVVVQLLGFSSFRIYVDRR